LIPKHLSLFGGLHHNRFQCARLAGRSFLRNIGQAAIFLDLLAGAHATQHLASNVLAEQTENAIQSPAQTIARRRLRIGGALIDVAH